MELTLMNMYQTLKNGDVHFNVNRMISFFGTTSYITEETWGYIAILIVNTLDLDNKEETLLYYYQKMILELKEKNIKFNGYKRKISQVVPTLTRIYGKNTFCWLEISFSLIRSMISWFPFRNRALRNPPGPQLGWKVLSELERKYPNIDTDEVADLLRKSDSSASMIQSEELIFSKAVLRYTNNRKSLIPTLQDLSSGVLLGKTMNYYPAIKRSIIYRDTDSLFGDLASRSIWKDTKIPILK